MYSNEWMFGLEGSYERHGNANDVVFPCRFTIASDGDTNRLYYNEADASIALDTSSIRALLECLEQHNK